jgi:hypothetical protein
LIVRLNSLVIAFVVACAFIAGVACQNGQPAPVSPGVVTDVTVGVDAAVCALNTYATDQAAGMSWEALVADVAVKCGIPVAKVVGLLDAHRGAEVKEGYALRPIAGKDAGP